MSICSSSPSTRVFIAAFFIIVKNEKQKAHQQVNEKHVGHPCRTLFSHKEE